MSNTRTVTIYEEDVIVQRPVDSLGVDVVDDGANRIIEVIAEGPRGPIGPQGPPGYSGAGEPFYVITSGSLYATTASLAIFATFSSSINPWTGSNGQSTFDLGSVFNPWRRLYTSESIFIVKSGSILVELKGSENTLEIGQTKITTASIGFNNPVISRIASDQQTYQFRSGSVSSSFNSNGIFIVPDFNMLPIVVSGGLIKSGSGLFVGL